MKKYIIPGLLLVCLAACQHSNETSASNQNNTSKELTMEKSAIEKLLFAYRDALNASDVSKVVTLYDTNGVFMPSNGPSAVGQDEINASYEHVFSSIQLNIEFFVDEIVQEGDFAFARTTSRGTTLIHANGQTVPEENRELFVLQKKDGQWKIARYMFNKMS